MTLEHDSTLAVADLVDQPGSARPLGLLLAIPDDFSLEAIDMVGPVELTGVLESVVEGLLVRGRLRVGLRPDCALCLQPLQTEVEVEVVELFSDPDRLDPGVCEDDIDAGYEIRDGLISLDVLLRDALATATPYKLLCQPDCLGLCAQCGTDRNQTNCTCVDTKVDARWAGLEGLRLPAEGSQRDSSA